MLLKCVAKIFALEPRANAIEASIIGALIVVALLTSTLAMRDSLASFYDTVVSDIAAPPPR